MKNVSQRRELVSENGSKCKSSSHCGLPASEHLPGQIPQMTETKELSKFVKRGSRTAFSWPRNCHSGPGDRDWRGGSLLKDALLGFKMCPPPQEPPVGYSSRAASFSEYCLACGRGHDLTLMAKVSGYLSPDGSLSQTAGRRVPNRPVAKTAPFPPGTMLPYQNGQHVMARLRVETKERICAE